MGVEPTKMETKHHIVSSNFFWVLIIAEFVLLLVACSYIGYSSVVNHESTEMINVLKEYKKANALLGSEGDMLILYQARKIGCVYGGKKQRMDCYGYEGAGQTFETILKQKGITDANEINPEIQFVEQSKVKK